MASNEIDPPSINPRIYTKAQLESIASEFLASYGGDPLRIPIDIELIIEKELGIRISPFPSLQLFYGIEAYLTLSRKTICVDPFLMDLDQHERRYRFTLAEEVAHATIHRDLFKGVRTPDDYVSLYDALDGEVYRWMDRNAKYLAGAILMPAHTFETRAAVLFQEMEKFQSTSGRLEEESQIRIISGLAEIFEVSQRSAGIRFKHLGLDRRLGIG